MKKKLIISLMCILIASFSVAQDMANYTISLGISPFGASLNYTYHKSEKTSINFAIGGLPETDLATFASDLDYFSDDFELNSNSSWMGIFINHRPFKNAKWFSFIGGFGVGSIENTIVDIDKNETYTAHYKENPVGYFGWAFGSGPVKGFNYSLDIGLLYTGGPEVIGPDEMGLDAINDSMFFLNTLPNIQVTIGYGF